MYGFPNAVDQADKLSVKVVDMGPDGTLGGDPDDDVSFTYEISGPLASQSWISVDLDLSSLPS